MQEYWQKIPSCCSSCLCVSTSSSLCAAALTIRGPLLMSLPNYVPLLLALRETVMKCFFKGQRRLLELALTQAEAFVMRVTHHSALSTSPASPHVRGGCWQWWWSGLTGGAVHTGAVVLSVWHIKLYKGNHLCATPHYWTAWRQLMRAKAKGIYPPLCCETDIGRKRKPTVFGESLFSGKKGKNKRKVCVWWVVSHTHFIYPFIYLFPHPLVLYLSYGNSLRWRFCKTHIALRVCSPLPLVTSWLVMMGVNACVLMCK